MGPGHTFECDQTTLEGRGNHFRLTSNDGDQLIKSTLLTVPGAKNPFQTLKIKKFVCVFDSCGTKFVLSYGEKPSKFKSKFIISQKGVLELGLIAHVRTYEDGVLYKISGIKWDRSSQLNEKVGITNARPHIVLSLCLILLVLYRRRRCRWCRRHCVFLH